MEWAILCCIYSSIFITNLPRWGQSTSIWRSDINMSLSEKKKVLIYHIQPWRFSPLLNNSYLHMFRIPRLAAGSPVLSPRLRPRQFTYARIRSYMMLHTTYDPDSVCTLSIHANMPPLTFICRTCPNSLRTYPCHILPNQFYYWQPPTTHRCSLPPQPRFSQHTLLRSSR